MSGRLRAGLAFALALGALCAALYPLLLTPRVSDDVINYSFRWLDGGEFVRATHEEIKHWALSSGRIFAFSGYLKNLAFLAFESTLAYKLYLLALNLACAGALMAYATLATRTRVAAIAAVACLPFLIQLRDYHDPVVSFNGLFQISAALVFASLALHLRYVLTGDKRLLHACVAVFVANLLFYELAAIAIVLVWIQERTLRPQAKWKYLGTLMLGTALAAYGALCIVARLIGIRAFNLAGTQSYGVGLDAWQLLLTLAKQLLAVFPFSYFTFRPRNGAWDVQALADPVPWLASPLFYVAALLFAAAAWVAIRLALRQGAGESEPAASAAPDGIRTAALVALGLVLLPALVIASIGKYQNAFAPGNGYSVVYMQEMGAALLAGAGVAWLSARSFLRVPALALGCIAVGIASAGNLVNNLAVAAKLREAWGPQYAWAAMLRSPAFRQLCADVGVVVTDFKPWNEYRIVQHAGFRFAGSAEVFATARNATAPLEVCVARTIFVGSAQAPAYARLRIAPGSAESRLLSSIRFLVPQEESRWQEQLAFARRCQGPASAPIATWTFIEGRYNLFEVEPSRAAPDLRSRGFAMGCEAPG